MPGAGELREKVHFLRRTVDIYDRPTDDFEVVFTRSCKVVWDGWSEAAIEGRLQGVATAKIHVRAGDDVRQVTSAWRLELPRLQMQVGAETQPMRLGVTCQPTPTADRAFLMLTAKYDGAQPS